MKTKLVSVLLGVIFAGQVQATEIDQKVLTNIVQALNYVCGDNWCNGGDYTFKFLSAAYSKSATRLVLKIKVRGVTSEAKGSRVRRCAIYGITSAESILTQDQKGIVENDVLTNALDACVDTITLNP